MFSAVGFAFLGVSVGDALGSLPPPKSLYYQQLIANGDEGFYQTIKSKKNRDLALIHKGEIESCVLISAHLNKIDPDDIRSIMRSESGWPGAKMKTLNGSGDVGIMQINKKIWNNQFSSEGVHLDWDSVRDDPCTNIYVGGVILARRLNAVDNKYEGLANYHRRMTDYNSTFHLTYRKRTVKHLLNIQIEYSKWLSNLQNTLTFAGGL